MRWKARSLQTRVVEVWDTDDPGTVWSLVSPEWLDWMDIIEHGVPETDTVRLVTEGDLHHFHFARYPDQPITLHRRELAGWAEITQTAGRDTVVL